jgi:hypothetical protein
VVSLIISYSSHLVLLSLLPRNTRQQQSDETRRLFLVDQSLFSSFPFLEENKSVLENYFTFLCRSRSDLREGARATLGMRFSPFDLLDFLIHYQQFVAVRIHSFSVSVWCSLLPETEENTTEQSRADLSLFNQKWLSLITVHSKFCFTKELYTEKKNKRNDKENIRNSSNNNTLVLLKAMVDGFFGEFLLALSDLEATWKAFFFGKDKSQFFSLCTELEEDFASGPSSLPSFSFSLYGFQAMVRSLKLSKNELWSCSSEMVLLWSLVQQANICEAYQRAFSANEIIYSQAVHNIHRICLQGDFTKIQALEKDKILHIWNSFSLKTLYQLAESCESLGYVPRVVTQGLFSALYSSFSIQNHNSSGTSSSSLVDIEFRDFQRAFCSDFFRSLASKGEFFSLFQLERLVKLNNNNNKMKNNNIPAFQLNLLDDLYHSLFSCDSQQKELFLELIFAIYILKNDFRKAAQLFLSPPVPGLLTSRCSY